MKNFILALFLFFMIFSCANHPTILPGKLEQGETAYSYSFSVENIVPVYTLSYGLNNKIVRRMLKQTFWRGFGLVI